MAARARRAEVTEKDPGIAASYATAFAVGRAEGDDRTPEEWARSAFEDAPRVVRWFVLFGWRYVLGFVLGPRPSPVHVSGWSVLRTEPAVLVLGVQSRLLTAHKWVRVEHDTVVMTTFVHYAGALGRVAWTLVVPVHHRTEPYLLGRAAASARR
jgi:hypothetical protein